MPSVAEMSSGRLMLYLSSLALHRQSAWASLKSAVSRKHSIAFDLAKALSSLMSEVRFRSAK